MKTFEIKLPGGKMDSLMEGLVAICILAVVFGFILGLYFLPTILALALHHPHALAVFLLNFFTGWSGVGWIGALIWSVIV
jgi:hypothetical protein